MSEKMNRETSTVRKFFMFLSMLAFAIAVAGGAYYTALREYKTTKAEILEREHSIIKIWIEGTTEGIRLWTQSLGAQAKRVSSSEIYRLFASEASALDKAEAARLNQGNLSRNTLSEQVPLMRNVLLDFMNFNGLSDARIIGENGLTLLSAQARPMPMDAFQVNVAKQAMENNSISFSPIVRYQKGLLIHLADPLTPVLGQVENSKPIGSLLLSTPVTSTIAQFLAREVQGGTAIPYIIQNNNGVYEIVNVNSTKLGSIQSPIEVDANGNIPFAYRTSVSNKNEYVWSAGQHIPYLDWWVVAEIPVNIVNAKLQNEATKIFGFAGLIAIGFILLLALLWWIVVGREQKANAHRFEQLYRLIGEQKHILDNVNSALDTGLLAANTNGMIFMANRAFGELTSCNFTTLEHTNLAALFDPNFAHELLVGIGNAANTGTPLTAEYTAILNEESRLLRLTFYPFLDENGQIQRNAEQNSVLVTFTDITEFRRQSNARRNIQEKSMQALVRAVESMDPYLSGHSRRMEKIAFFVCQYLDLGEDDTNVVSIAANLSQVGKLFVPRDLLLKTGNLTADERAILLSVPQKAWEILKDIDFHLPVPRAVHTMYERLDGTGYPQRLSAADIDIHARILGVVNAFCAMTAPRSYRGGSDISVALADLRKDVKGLDQNVVTALTAVLNTVEGQALAKPIADIDSD